MVGCSSVPTLASSDRSLPAHANKRAKADDPKVRSSFQDGGETIVPGYRCLQSFRGELVLGAVMRPIQSTQRQSQFNNQYEHFCLATLPYRSVWMLPVRRVPFLYPKSDRLSAVYRTAASPGDNGDVLRGS